MEDLYMVFRMISAVTALFDAQVNKLDITTVEF